jgi:hypothetical protein
VIVFVTCLAHLWSSLSGSATALATENSNERRVVQTSNDREFVMMGNTTKGDERRNDSDCRGSKDYRKEIKDEGNREKG